MKLITVSLQTVNTTALILLVLQLTIGEARQFASNNLIDRLNYNLYDVADTSLVDPTTGRLNSSANLLVNDRWEDALFRDNANFTSTNVNISGGAEKIDYYFLYGNRRQQWLYCSK